jgi:hypothetical protein
MFNKLREKWNKATNPFQGYLGVLWTVWEHDVARAILLARLAWQALPVDIVQHAATIEAAGRAAQEERGINDAVDRHLGMLGIAPGAAGGFGANPGMNPDHAMFISVMGSIRAHQGDPPAQPEMAVLAPAVLRGELDPIQAMVQSAPAFTQQQLLAAVQAMQLVGMSQLMRVMAVVQAATALPRGQIAQLLPPEHKAPAH